VLVPVHRRGNESCSGYQLQAMGALLSMHALQQGLVPVPRGSRSLNTQTMVGSIHGYATLACQEAQGTSTCS
jgi:hypothetical protein